MTSGVAPITHAERDALREAMKPRVRPLDIHSRYRAIKDGLLRAAPCTATLPAARLEAQMASSLIIVAYQQLHKIEQEDRTSDGWEVRYGEALDKLEEFKRERDVMESWTFAPIEVVR